MQPFTVVTGTVAPLPAANVDTDVILPKQFLKGVDRSGLSDAAFHDLRFAADGSRRDEFILNRPGWQDAAFLAVGPNFGCGSSREHAVWGLRQLGIRALIGTSFAGIFFDNCARNGLLALTLEPAGIEQVLATAADAATNTLTVDLERQSIELHGGGRLSFEIEPQLKHMLVQGLDAVGLTLQRRGDIEAFEQSYAAEHPWLG